MDFNPWNNSFQVNFASTEADLIPACERMLRTIPPTPLLPIQKVLKRAKDVVANPDNFGHAMLVLTETEMKESFKFQQTIAPRIFGEGNICERYFEFFSRKIGINATELCLGSNSKVNSLLVFYYFR